MTDDKRPAPPDEVKVIVREARVVIILPFTEERRATLGYGWVMEPERARAFAARLTQAADEAERGTEGV